MLKALGKKKIFHFNKFAYFQLYHKNIFKKKSTTSQEAQFSNDLDDNFVCFVENNFSSLKKNETIFFFLLPKIEEEKSWQLKKLYIVFKLLGK